MNQTELKALCLLPGASGREAPVRNYILKELEQLPLPDCLVQVDRLGNLIVQKQGKKNNVPRIMIAAHMDEVAMMVTDITADGALRFGAVGGIDAAAMIGRQVCVGSDGIQGVIGACPIHRLSAEQRKTAAKAEDLAVDIGAADRADAEKYVSLGDIITFAPAYHTLHGGKIAAKALDDRYGCSLLLSLLREDLPCELTVAFTVQEEVGLRGATVAANAIKPEIAIVLETTTAADFPDSADPVCKLGDGAVISFIDGRTVYDAALYHLAVQLCKEQGIPWQTKTKIAGGNDAGAIQNSGARVLAISAPCRNLHAPLCVMQESDADACDRLLHAMIYHLAKHGAPAL